MSIKREELEARMRAAAGGATRELPPIGTAPAPTGRRKPPKYTVLLEAPDRAALKRLAEECGHRLGRDIDRADVFRGLIRLADRDITVLAGLIGELSEPSR
jgi:hypothetical protein